MNLQRLLPWASRPAATLPRSWSEALAACAGEVAAHCAPRERAVLSENLRLATACTPSQATVRGAFHNYARYYLAMMRLAHHEPTQAVGEIRWDGVEALARSLEAGRGALVLTGHLGNWDVLGVGLAARFGPIGGFAEVLEPPSLFAYYSKVRARHAVRIAPVGAPGRMPFAVLARNGILALVADRPFGAHVATAACGTAQLQVPVGAIRLALRNSSPIHAAFALRERGGFRLQCGPNLAAGLGAELDARARVQQVAARFAAALQRAVAAHPDQWCLLVPLAGTARGAA